MSNKVDIATATADIDRWLDFKKVNEKRRDDNKSSIDTLISAVMAGTLTVDGECKLHQTLLFPKGEGATAISQLTYRPRMETREVQKYLVNVAPNDIVGRVTGYIACLTNESKGVIQVLDSEDNQVAQAIALFFI
jgi:hypothetical protein